MAIQATSVGDALSQIWDEATGTQAAPSTEAVLATAGVALALVFVPRLWRIARHAVTIAHEGSHGLAALLTGRTLLGIRLHSDTSGLAISRGRPTGPGMIATAAAGYVGPGLFGLGAACLLSRGHALGVLWLTVLLLALLLVQIRNFYGLYAVLVAGAGVFAISWWGTPGAQSLVAYAGTWFLLLAAPRPVFELQVRRRRGSGSGQSDADVLAAITPFPGLVWVALFLIATTATLLLGARLMLGTALAWGP